MFYGFFIRVKTVYVNLIMINLPLKMDILSKNAVEAAVQLKETAGTDIRNAKVIVSIGRGLGSQENIENGYFK